MLSRPYYCQPYIAPVIIHHHTSDETEPHAKSRGGRRGKSQRASDMHGMPLCHRHHSDLHDRLGLSGFFESYDRFSLRAWQDQQVERLQRLYAMACPEPLAPAAAPKRKRVGAGWTAAGVRDWCRKEARVRSAAAADALTELANLIEEDTL